MYESQSSNVSQVEEEDDNKPGHLSIGRPPMTSAQHAHTYHQLPNPAKPFEQALTAFKAQCGNTDH